jgi:hypothetical protein
MLDYYAPSAREAELIATCVREGWSGESRD